MRHFIAILGTTVCLIGFAGCDQSTRSKPQLADKPQPTDSATTSLPRAVYNLLKANKTAGSLVVQARCGNHGLVDRGIQAAGTPQNANLADDLTQLIRPENDLSWREVDGFVRITDKLATAGILGVRLSEFRVSIRDPLQVVNSLWSQPEVIMFMRDHGLDRIQTPSHISAFGDSIPPIDIQLQNASVQDVLDRSAIQLKGMWVYMECSANSKQYVSLDLAQF